MHSAQIFMRIYQKNESKNTKIIKIRVGGENKERKLEKE